MLQQVSTPDSAQSNCAGGKLAVGKSLNGKSAVDDSEWFADVARQLLPAKAGTALHFITGFDERLCQRYAAGHVKPPAYFLRALLRSEQGATWLAALMHGCDVAWWLEHKHTASVGAAAINAIKRD